MAIPLLESLRVSAANLCRDRPLLIISHQATLTGAPAVVESLGMHMKMLGCSIIYLVIETGPQIQAYHSIGLVYQLSDFENSPIQAIKHIIERHRPFAVVCNTITTTDYAQLIKTEAPDITCLGWIHEMPTVINSFFGGHQTATRAAAYCDRLIFGSKFVRDRFAHEYAVPPSLLGILPYIRKIPPSSMGLSQHAGLLPQSSADAVEQRHSGKYLIIGCGTAEPRKGLDIFVRVAAIILRESPADIAINISFEWYGCPSYNDNYVDFCKLDAKQLGIEEHIKFMPVSEDFRDRLHEATLFVLTSREDPYPLVILDSMASRVPFVCFDKAGGASDLANLGAGIAVPYGDEESFARESYELILDISRRKRMGGIGIKRLLQVNNWKNVLAGFFEILSELNPETSQLEPGANSLEGANCENNIISPKNIDVLPKYLVISFGPPPLPHIDAVEGGGLRCWNLATGISGACNQIAITLTYPAWYDHGASDLPSRVSGVLLSRWQDEDDLLEQVRSADVVVVSFCYGEYSLKIANTLRQDQRLILDCYVPIHVEMSARRSPNLDAESDAYEIERRRWEIVLMRGDLYLCSNTNQVHYYRGILYQLGRLNPRSYDQDPLVLAPFGLASTMPSVKSKPIQALGVPSNSKKILWFGGVYPWFDLECLFEAINIVNQSIPCSLIVVGVRNPFNGHPDFIRLANEVEQLAMADRYRGLVFMADWVKYQDRADWYLDSDLTVMISAEGIENQYAWRTRLVDYLWSGIHVATSGQDLLSKDMINCGLASKLETGSASQIAASLHEALINAENPKLVAPDLVKRLKDDLNIAKIGQDILSKSISLFHLKL